MSTIKNREEITEALAHMLRMFDMELRNYQTDVYMYIDGSGVASLEEFVNVGGNSWLDDAHITIYSDREHYNTHVEAFEDAETLAEAAGITMEDVAKWVDPEEPEEDAVSFNDVREYIMVHDGPYDRMREAYNDLLPDFCEYEQAAEEILDGALNTLEKVIEND